LNTDDEKEADYFKRKIADSLKKYRCIDPLDTNNYLYTWDGTDERKTRMRYLLRTKFLEYGPIQDVYNTYSGNIS
jgi:hypothetical protein